MGCPHFDYLYVSKTFQESFCLIQKPVTHFRSLVSAWIIYSLLEISKHIRHQIKEREREKKKSDFLCFLRKKMALISDTFLSNVSKLKQVYKKCVRMYNHSVHPFWHAPFQRKNILLLRVSLLSIRRLNEWISQLSFKT